MLAGHQWCPVFICTLITTVIYKVDGTQVEHVIAPSRGSVTLPCQIRPESAEDELLLVLWYKVAGGAESSPIYSYDVRSKSGTAKRWSSEDVFGKRAYFITSGNPAGLLIANLSPKDEGTYICRTDFRKTPTKHWKINLEVVIPPGTPRVFDGGGKMIDARAGPYSEGSVVSFNCSSDGGKPPPEISWYYNNSLIYSSRHAGKLANTIKVKLMKRDDGGTLTCTAENSNFTEPARKTFKIDLLLPPTVTAILKSNEPLSAGREYEFVCQSAGSKPPAVITWWMDDEQLFSAVQTEAQGIVTSTLKFVPEAADDGRILECRATNNSMDDESLEDIAELSVLYAPTLNVVLQQTNLELREEMTAQLECQQKANPEVAKIEWLKDGEMVMVDPDRVTTSKSSLIFRSISRSDSGQYTCSGQNQEGVSTSFPYYLQVMYPPYCAPGVSKILKVKTLTPLTVECRVDAFPAPLTFTWIRNSTGKVLTQLTQDGSTSRALLDITHFGYSEAIICFARNELGKQKDPCTYQIVYEGPPSKPANCTLSQTHSSVYVLTCLPPLTREPQFYLLQVTDLDTDQVTTNLTSSTPIYTFVVKDSTSFVVSDNHLQNIVMLSRKRTMCRLFGVNQHGMSESVDTFINEEGAAHLKQEEMSSEMLTQALVISCICIFAALFIGILVLLIARKFFTMKKRRRIDKVQHYQGPQHLNIPLEVISAEPLMHKLSKPSETEL